MEIPSMNAAYNTKIYEVLFHKSNPWKNERHFDSEVFVGVGGGLTIRQS